MKKESSWKVLIFISNFLQFFSSVVTGVRFSKISKVIFLQLQSVKLDASGDVDKNSIHWMDEPKDLKENFHTLNFDQKNFTLFESKDAKEGKVMKGEKIFLNFFSQPFVEIFLKFFIFFSTLTNY